MNVKFYYDANIMCLDAESKFIYFSPFNCALIKANDKVKFIIDMILKSNGKVTPEEIKARFNNHFNVNINVDQICSQINNLVQSKLIFNSYEAYKAEKTIVDDTAKNEFNLKTVYIHLTLRCNLNCSYCYNKENLNSSENELDTETWIKIINGLKDIGVTHFIFTGGETLIRDDFQQILEITKEKSTRVGLLTNGTLLSNIFESILPSLDYIILSLDSLDIDINKLNRGDYKYNEILRLLMLASEKAPDKVVIRSVITKYNHNNILKFQKYIRDTYGLKTKSSGYMPFSEEEIDDYIYYEGYDNCINHMSLNKSIRMCGACSNLIAIGPEGNVYPCQCMLSESTVITNILKNHWIKELKEHHISRVFSELRVNDIEECQDCNYRYLCGGGCRALAYNIYGDIKGAVKFLCEARKKEAIRIIKNDGVNWKTMNA